MRDMEKLISSDLVKDVHDFRKFLDILKEYAGSGELVQQEARRASKLFNV
jgi:hypothetical protein